MTAHGLGVLCTSSHLSQSHLQRTSELTSLPWISLPKTRLAIFVTKESISLAANVYDKLRYADTDTDKGLDSVKRVSNEFTEPVLSTIYDPYFPQTSHLYLNKKGGKYLVRPKRFFFDAEIVAMHNSINVDHC